MIGHVSAHPSDMSADLAPPPPTLQSGRARIVLKVPSRLLDKEVGMSLIRQSVHASLLAAACAVLVFAACVPPIAWHDGLPAWSPEQKDVEWRVGVQRLSAFGADTFELLDQQFAAPDFNVSYLTPGVRWGLGHGPLAADVGIASVLVVGSGLGMLVGPTFGVGSCDTNFSVMFRPSLYMFSLSFGGEGLQLIPWYQLELLLGNGHRARGVSFAAGGRASPFAVGPVGVADLVLHPIDLRAEVSYMIPAASVATGTALTIGLSVATPTRREPASKQDGQ